MAGQSLLDILNKYHPDADIVAVLNAATDIHVRTNKENRLLEVEAHFPKPVPKNVLHRIEFEVKQTYVLNYVHIFPHYDVCFLNDAYISEVMEETENRGIVARGFFAGYRFTFSGDRLNVEVPIADGGVALMCHANTPQVMEDIIESEFGVKVKVTITHFETDESVYVDRKQRMEEQIYGEMKAASDRFDRMPARGSEGSEGRHDGDSGEEEKNLLRVASVFSDLPEMSMGDGKLTIGFYQYDVSAPQYLMGNEFPITPISASSITAPIRNIVIIGKVFAYLAEETRNGDKMNISFGIFDGNASISVKKYSVTKEEAAELGNTIKNGMYVAMRGYAKKEMHKDRVDTDFTFFFSDIASVKRLERVDRSEKKRVELHLHTQLSSMDALIPPDVVVKTARKWGMKSIALTDHGNVQGFPEAMIEKEKKDTDDDKVKLIYGMEAYFVNDESGAIKGEYAGTFSDEMIAFDIETTGISLLECRITEIGAVRIVDGKVTDRFDTFVNPECPIPAEITELTSITDEMVADAPKTKEALEAFFAFIGDKEGEQPHLMIAHNADFDMGFIRHYAEENGLSFTNPYLDTVALSRHINKDLKNHKLDTVAEHYHLGDFHHHRACDDAEMLALIFIAMTDQLSNSEIHDFADLKMEMSEHADPLKLPTYHQILLAKNKVGLKNLYRLISCSYLQYYKRYPRIPKTELEKYREGLIIGSACEAGEVFRAILEGRSERELEELVNFYDYLEIQPIANNRFLVAEGRVADDEGLRNLNRRIVALGEKYHKPVVATCDAHFLNPEDEINRRILLAGMKFKDADKPCPLYLRTTEEMLDEFSYLGEEKAYEVVVANTNLISDMIEEIRPIPKGNYPPHLEGAEEELQNLCWTHAKEMYGDPVPELVAKRLDKELTSIIKNGFAVLYIIAQKLVFFSESQGYLVGSRGSVGSSFVATMAGISEVNPLPPHYFCRKCKKQEFFLNGEVGSGFDLPDKNCPICGQKYEQDGHNIPFETFLGFKGDKSPDIDLNFSGEVQGRVHKYTEELFGAENVFRAGTLGTLADKTAYGFVARYFEDRGKTVCRAEMDRLVGDCVGVKRTTGQHPGGIIVVPREFDVYDFTPIQHPADSPDSDIVTTHFAFTYLHDTILKLDELGHDVPTKYKMIERFSNTNVMEVPMNDLDVYELFLSTKSLGVSPDDIGCNLGTMGLPEFGTRFAMRMLEDAKPHSFADLLQISGLSHGTDVWTGNAQDLIKNNICTISEVIGCRDNIMNDLIRFGVENSMAFKIMESVRKGKGLTPEWEDAIKASSAPDWYIPSCKKIKYMFPKAHAAAYVMSAIRLGWYKVHMPAVFYGAILTAAPGGFDAEIVRGGQAAIRQAIKDIEEKDRNDVTAKDGSIVSTLQLVNEAIARGIKFLPVDIEKSDAHAFAPENGSLRMPFSALPGLGENAAENIIKARVEDPFFSVEDLQTRAKLSKSVIDILRRNHVLDNFSETNQLSFF